MGGSKGSTGGEQNGGAVYLAELADTAGQSHPASVTYHGRAYGESLRVACGSADVMRNNSLPTWNLDGYTRLSTNMVIDTTDGGRLSGSTAYITFLANGDRPLHSPYAVRLGNMSTITKMDLKGAQQISVRCVSTNPNGEALFSVYLLDPAVR